jgi:predicted unusual protein kinase regulating ubiquinone biosynthesis (AarF/ABC1/UbiB family)
MYFVTRALEITLVFGILAMRVLFLALQRSILRLPRSQFHEKVGKLLLDSCESLSGAFIKFGQLLSTRIDLLPEEVTAKLSGLLDRVSPGVFTEDLRLICAELDLRDTAEVFSIFVRDPLAAASFATVYTAKLKTGEDVVLKVQRRGLARRVGHDILILKAVAHILDFVGIFRRVRITQLTEEFAEWTEVELDYHQEALHIEYFRKLHAPDFDLYPEGFLGIFDSAPARNGEASRNLGQ